MVDTSREKILKINTQGAEKNVKTLKQQIKDLKEQLAQLDKNTEEYNRVSQQLAQTNQKQIEINEAMKYSNKDLGATLSNLTKVSAGVIGAINGINSVMVMMGGDSEEAQEAMKTIQMTMALIQGMSAVDVAGKALKGLVNAFRDFNTVKGTNAVITAGATTSELLEAGALAKNTAETHKNNIEGKKFNELNEKSAEYSKESALAIAAEKEALKGNTQETKNLIAELERLKAAKAAQSDIGNNTAKKVITNEINERKAATEALLSGIGNGSAKGVESLKNQIKNWEKLLNDLESGTVDTVQAVSMAWRSLAMDLNSNIRFNLPTDDIKKSMAEISALMSPEQIERKITELSEAMNEEVKIFNNSSDAEAKAAELTRLRNESYTEQIAILESRKAEMASQMQQEEFIKKKIIETTGAINGETTSLNTNTGAKEANAEATDDVADAEKKLGTETKKNDPILRKAWSGLTTGIKNAGKALWSFVKTNPILAAITAVVIGIGIAIGKWAKKFNEAHKEALELAQTQNALNFEYERQYVQMDSLVKMFESENASAEQQEVLAKEINKLAGEELATRNKITGEWEISNEQLEKYQENLKTQIALEYHRSQIQELFAKEEEARNNQAYEQNHLIGKLFRTANSYDKEAEEYEAQREKHWREIEKLTAGTVNNLKNQNKEVKVTTKSGGGGIVKAFKDIAIEVRDILLKTFAQLFDLKELKMRYNGVYTETEHLLLRIKKTIESNNLSEKLTEQFKNALETGDLRNYGITFDYIFDKEKVDELVDKQAKAYEKLQRILEKKKGGSATDKEVQTQKAVVEEFNKQITAMKELADGVQAYADAWDKINEKQRKHTQTEIQYDRELRTELDYMLKRSSGDINAETEKSVKLAEQQLEIAEQQYNEDKKHLELLKQKVEANKQNQKIYEDYLEYQEKVLQSQKDWYDARIALDNEYYNQRQERVKQFYDAYEKETEKAVKDISGINNFLSIMHFDDYNSEVIALETQRTMLERLKAQIVKYYDEQLEINKDNAQMVMLLEQEKNAALLQMSKEQADKEVEIEDAKVRRKIEIQRTYINLYQSLSSQISSLLSAEMSNYDENSSKYKQLKYAQGVTDTLSGTLSAFMSGIESGVPAPWNLGVATAMALTTFATGVAQLKNIKNGTLANSATANTVNIGEYDTLTYQNSVDILSAIQDQRVWVSMTDIQDTGRRVEVLESQATF